MVCCWDLFRFCAEEQCGFDQKLDGEPLRRDDGSGEWFELLHDRNLLEIGDSFGI